jgi:hypothetical protein
MSTASKFLPVLALAVALSPFAAQARTGASPVADAAHPVYLLGTNAQFANNDHGRAHESDPASGLFLGDAPAEYAATSNANVGQN